MAAVLGRVAAGSTGGRKVHMRDIVARLAALGIGAIEQFGYGNTLM
jgi:hypothetical protein